MFDDSNAKRYPGEILQLEFLEPLNITPYRLSKDIGVAQTRISEILSGNAVLQQIQLCVYPTILATPPSFG